MEMSVAVGLRTLFCVLGCVMLATLIYTLSVDGFPFRKDLLTPWMSATLLDFYINVVALGAWVCYKESNWISASLWMVMLVCFGSITTCFYIVLQFLKLSTYDALEDPIHYVLLRYPSKWNVESAKVVLPLFRILGPSFFLGWSKICPISKNIHQNRDGVEDKRRFSVVTTRIFFSALGCLMLATLVYTISTDGSPFRRELFTPWMTATLVDFYINIVALSVWVAYKESSWINAFTWIVLLICFGSITTCTYIVRQLFHLSSQDAVHFILLKSSNRQV